MGLRPRAALAALALVACQAEPSDDRLPLPPVSGRDGGPPAADAGGDGPFAAPDAARPPDAAPVEPADRLRIATYNVQNLFDLTDDPDTEEYEFTPAPGRWDAPRLARRLERLAEVFRAIDADVVAVNEIENEAVLRQLRDAIAERGGPRYPYVAAASGRDPRGIDLGLLSRFPVVQALNHPIDLAHRCQGPEGPIELDGSLPEARPVLQADLNLAGDEAPELTLLVNHWKAKSADSYPCSDEEHRRRSAREVAERVAAIAAGDPDRGIIVLGDFNAFEFEAPLAEVLGAALAPDGLTAPGDLYNAWGEASGVEPGRDRNSNAWNNVANSSYNFHGDWTRLDHLLVNGNLLGEGRAGWRLVPGSTTSVHPDFLLDRDGTPRSWSMEEGDGYSDHLPVRLDLQRVAPTP